MELIVSVLACVYAVGFAWAARLLFRTLMHERHMAARFELGLPPRWWEYPACAAFALLWPVPMLACLVVDFFSMDDG